MDPSLMSQKNERKIVRDNNFVQKKKAILNFFRQGLFPDVITLCDDLEKEYGGKLLDQILSYKAVGLFMLDKYEESKIILCMLEMFHQERGVSRGIMFDVYLNLSRIALYENSRIDWNKYVKLAENCVILSSQRKALDNFKKNFFIKGGKFETTHVEVCD